MPDNNMNFASGAAPAPDGTGQLSAAARGGFVGNTFVALRYRNFRLFFMGQIVSLIGTWMQSTAQGWLVYELTGSKVLLGVVSAVGSAPMLFFSLWGGSVADRHSKRNIIILTQITLMLLAYIFAGLVWSRVIQSWHILVLAGLGGVAMAFDMPARQAFMVEMTSREDLINAISLNSSAVNGARVVGPSIAGILMAQIGLAVCFLLNGLSYLAVIAGLLMMRLPKHVPPPRTSSSWAHVSEGFAYVCGQRRLRLIFTLFAMVGTFGWSYAVLMPAFATDILHTTQRGYGMLLSSNGIGALAGALTVASIGKHANQRLLVFGGLAVFSVMLFLLAFVTDYTLALAILGVSGWGMLLFFATINTLLQTSVTDEMRGRVMGIWALIFGGMTPVGGLVAGTLSHYFGLRTAIASGAVVCVGTGLIIRLMLPRRSRPGQTQVS